MSMLAGWMNGGHCVFKTYCIAGRTKEGIMRIHPFMLTTLKTP